MSTECTTGETAVSARRPADARADTPWYFRYRSRIIIALVAVLVLWPGPRLPFDVISAATGGVLVALGVILRVWCIRQIGGAARKRAVPKAARLVTWGPFGWVRNPIYIANMLVFAGFTVLAGLAWGLPVLLGLMFLQYTFTVRFEETFLLERFGEDFRSYCRETPRWFGWPRLRRAPEGFEPYPLRKLIKRERSFLLFQVPGGLLLLFLVRIALGR